jgi:hypothetical protein
VPSYITRLYFVISKWSSTEKSTLFVFSAHMGSPMSIMRERGLPANRQTPLASLSTGARLLNLRLKLQSALEQGSRDQERRDPKSKQEEQVHADGYKAAVLKQD